MVAMVVMVADKWVEAGMACRPEAKEATIRMEVAWAKVAMGINKEVDMVEAAASVEATKAQITKVVDTVVNNSNAMEVAVVEACRGIKIALSLLETLVTSTKKMWTKFSDM